MEYYKILSLEDIQNESWLPDIEYPSMYMVSNLGRIKSVGRYVEHKNGKVGYIKERILRQTCNGRKALTVVFSKKSIQIRVLVHRRIAMAFIPNPENKKTINHKNGNPKDNRLQNLEWATQLENNIHSINELGHKKNTNGLVNWWLKKGIAHPAIGNKKSHPSQKGSKHVFAVKFKCPTLDIYFGCIKDACDLLGLSFPSISDCLEGRKKHVKGLTFRYLQ